MRSLFGAGGKQPQDARRGFFDRTPRDVDHRPAFAGKKPPRIGDEVVWHQDATFLHTEPSRVLGMWFALDDANQENGCLWGLPGGHRRGLKARFLRNSDDSVEMLTLDDTPWPEADFVLLEVAKGALILLDGMLPHGSAANRSSVSRHAYSLHVIDGTCRYLPENWLQRSPDMPLRGFN